MTKKIFTIIIAFFTILFTSSIIFAEDNNSVRSEWNDSIDKTKNTMHNIGNGVESAISGVMNAERNMGNDMINNGNDKNNDNNYNNPMSSASTNMGNKNTNNTVATTTMDGNNGSGSRYSAVRTSTTTHTNNLFGLSNTAWTWIVMIIATAVIVSLIYYYGSQYENKTIVHNKDNE